MFVRLIYSSIKYQTLYEWCDAYEIYFKKCWIDDKETYFDCIVTASDEGIDEAHAFAATYFYNIAKDYKEGERRLFLLFHSAEVLPFSDAKYIVSTINEYLANNERTEGIIQLIEKLRGQGYTIVDENGDYMISREKG